MRIPLDTGLVAILRTKSEEASREIAQELVKAGIKLIEFTTTTPGALNLVEEFSANKDLYVGLGTCITKEHVASGKAAGAQCYVVIRDVTCRLFGYHGLTSGAAFSLDHMFGF